MNWPDSMCEYSYIIKPFVVCADLMDKLTSNTEQRNRPVKQSKGWCRRMSFYVSSMCRSHLTPGDPEHMQERKLLNSVAAMCGCPLHWDHHSQQGQPDPSCQWAFGGPGTLCQKRATSAQCANIFASVGVEQKTHASEEVSFFHLWGRTQGSLKMWSIQRRQSAVKIAAVLCRLERLLCRAGLLYWAVIQPTINQFISEQLLMVLLVRL